MANYILGHSFYCTQCGEKGIPIVRKAAKGRKAGHLKKLYCLNCKKETNHVECIDCTHYTYADFLLEYTNNNFDNHGKRKMKYGELRTKLSNGGLL